MYTLVIVKKTHVEFVNGDNYCAEVGCPDGYVADCSGEIECAPASWIGDGYCDGEDQQFGYDLTCYDNDGGDCDVAIGDSCQLMDMVL